MPKVKENIDKLPPDLQQEVEDFVEYLLEKCKRRNRVKPRFEWAGVLKDLRTQYTSVELQHKISKWRIGVE